MTNQNRRHVFFDLQPYVCTFQNCSSDSFSSRHEWFNHELDSHRKQWHCTKCSHINFASASQLRSHFDSKHQGSFTDAQWPLILKACKRSSTTFGPSSCPLCFTWAPPRSEAYNAKEFCRHLGSHLQQLALTALPIAIEGLIILEDEDHNTTPGTSDNHDIAIERSILPDEDHGTIPSTSANHDFAIEEEIILLDEYHDTILGFSNNHGQGAGEAVSPYISAAPSERDIQRTRVKLLNFSQKDKYLVDVVFSDGNEWELKREYQEFYDLQAKLLERFDSAPVPRGYYSKLPLLPHPINHVTLAVAERQVSSIDTYLMELINLPTHQSMSDPILEFFKPREGDRKLPADEW